MCLQDRPENQNEATNARLFKCISEILVTFPKHKINETMMDMIEQLYNICAFGKLKDQLANHFL